MKAGVQPGLEAGLGGAQVHVGDTDLGESERTGPTRQPRHQALHVLVTLTHRPILGTRALAWPDESACEAFARGLASHPAIGDAFIELLGPLGAGKTTFARHLLRALGVAGRIKSPTYAVMEPYVLADGRAASHFDFYRFNDPREWLDAGLRDVFAAPGLKLAEWAEKAEGLLPPPDLRIAIEPIDEQARQVRVDAFTPRGVELLA
ncbi:MAG: tRNA (adenosine(37)-N6)-threonylcarbamoyltransferase complex ATPase subunit type 1 TsaE [Burkholderiales bacterium]|nr:tRNA (adenosine(37)-N6)-threonylcarbamoyltransferase complex ATPase subunit type 1 TsaE [Burkholderiales bacterium]